MNAACLNVENPYRYALHGYHPLDIPQELPEHAPRYRIVHKLGHGSFSTVWFAQDLHQPTSHAPSVHSYRYVAVKIMTADAKRPSEEAQLLRHLHRVSPPPLPLPLPPSTTASSSTGAISYQSSLPVTAASLFLRILPRWRWHLSLPSPSRWPNSPRAAPCDPDDNLSSSPGVLPVLDEFEISGPNGTHRCLVTPVVGPSVASLKRFHLEGGLLPLELARCSAVQLVRAVASLHAAGVVHGDLHVGNIVLGLPNVDRMAVEELYETLGPPRKIPPPFDYDQDEEEEQCAHTSSSSWDGLEEGSPLPRSPPRYAVRPIETAKLWASLPHNASTTPTTSSSSFAVPLYILDFGEARLNTTTPGSSIRTERTKVPGTPLYVAPPEILLRSLRAEITAATDIWTLACTIFELFSGWPLFEMLFGDGNEVIADVVALLGKPPQRWWMAWRSRACWYTEEGTLVEDRASEWEGVPTQLEERVKVARGRMQDGVMQNPEGMPEGDVEVLVRVLRRALRYEPNERPTAVELLAMLPTEWASGCPAPLGLEV